MSDASGVVQNPKGIHFLVPCTLFRGSSSSHTWDAFQLAHSSFRLYCINVPTPETGVEDGEEKYLEELRAVKIYGDEVNIRFLVCGSASTLDASLLEPLEDGLNALLSIEVNAWE
ncbi:hypothetical protein M8C21_019781 [Ambrosia artemisiifolia]|uniref:Uncharacterized protein n=1 Tax=Ambrosia artemisiifolia TaxID=4212 RepID=A0AAD5GCR8_AMBAR|nr:hypothetical protein M8C21_019781 [Ambrosia artemisiifolia]